MTFPGVKDIIKPILFIVNSHKSQINPGNVCTKFIMKQNWLSAQLSNSLQIISKVHMNILILN